jgi:hypothetical protein
MDARSFDHLAKTFDAVGSRRLAIGWFLGGVFGLSRIGGGATHKTGHHSSPSHRHRCLAGQECRQVRGEWTCQDTCRDFGAGCASAAECCQDQDDPVFCRAQTPDGPAICDTDCLD